jgi:hypothetical protein
MQMQTNLPSSITGPSSGSSIGFNIRSLISTWGATFSVVLILVIFFAVYYQTIGYYFNLGWRKLGWSKEQNEQVEITMPGGGPTAVLTPASSDASDAGSPIHKSFGKALNKLESDVEAALGSMSNSSQVFNVSKNVYTFSEAEPLCRAFGAELATYDQVKHAYKSGADWCNYGWVKGQLAVYPTQQSTYDKLQAGPEADRMSCGRPGVNGGHFPNENQRFGVNCYGPRPAETENDRRDQEAETSDIAFDRQVNHFKSELASIGVNPFNSTSWSA